MQHLRTVAAFSLSCVAAIVGFLIYTKWKKKSNEPPDKDEASVKQKSQEKSFSSSPGHGSNLEKVDSTILTCSNSARKPAEDATQNIIDVAPSQNQTHHNVPELEVGTAMTETERILIKKSKEEPLTGGQVMPEDGSGDHNVEEGLIVEETVTAVKAEHTESIPSVPHEKILPHGKNVEVNNDQVMSADTVSSNEQDEPHEQIITPANAQGVYASSETSSLSASEQTVENSLLVSEQIVESRPPLTDQIVENNVKNSGSAKPSNDVKEAVSSASMPVVKNTSNTVECLDGSCDNDMTCKTAEDSLSRSWDEEVNEQCDTGVKHSDNISGFDSANKSPIPDLMKNGVSSETDGGLSEDRLTKSPLRTEDKKADDAQTGSDASSNCDNLSEASNDSGKGGSVTENSHQSANDEEKIYEFNIPSDMCGLFIGTRGKTVKTIRDQSGARIRLRNNPYTPDFQICVIEGPQSAIERALNIIKRKFPSIKYPGMDLTQLATAPVIMPEIMQLGLPEGVSVDIVVSSIVDAGRVFVQQPTHPSFPSLERLNAFMNQCYVQDGAVPNIPRPIESGVICAAPMLNGWYRAQIMTYYEASDECDIKYVDYGGYSHIASPCLKQIRSDFMTLPFEAVECYLGNITPLENESYFSAEAAVVLEELTQGKLLQAQVVGRAEDGIPYVHIYQINGSSSALLVNRELVNRGVARWLEMMS